MNYQTRRRLHRVKISLAFASVAALAVVLGVPAKAAEAQYFDYQDNGQISFNMPSGNIGCVYTPAGGTDVYETADGGAELVCDRVAPSYVRVVLRQTGEAYGFDDVGDASCCGFEQKFGYGKIWQEGPFQCQSATTGLTCLREDGHGFFISRARVQVR